MRGLSLLRGSLRVIGRRLRVEEAADIFYGVAEEDGFGGVDGVAAVLDDHQAIVTAPAGVEHEIGMARIGGYGDVGTFFVEVLDDLDGIDGRLARHHEFQRAWIGFRFRDGEACEKQNCHS